LPTQAFLDNQADQDGAEAVAIVVAESEDICEEALQALVVEWEEAIIPPKKATSEPQKMVRDTSAQAFVFLIKIP
jgi:CO/xanthine dehydrogenase Mo-binding subunit